MVGGGQQGLLVALVLPFVGGDTVNDEQTMNTAVDDSCFAFAWTGHAMLRLRSCSTCAACTFSSFLCSLLVYAVSQCPGGLVRPRGPIF
jgi:hypothetical protein